MTMFWVYAALLTGVALAIMLTPLLRGRSKSTLPVSRAATSLTVYRDQLTDLDADLAAGSIGQDQWEAARADLQRGLLEDTGVPESDITAPGASSRLAAVAVALAVPLVAIPVYLALGSPQGLNPSRASAEQGAPHELSKEQIEAMVARLAQRLESNPDDAEGWDMLGRTYGALGRYAEAVNAYAKAEVQFPQNAQLLADYADVLAMTQGQSLKGKPEALIRRALQADRNNLKALALAGTAEFEKQDYAKASDYWKRMLPLLPAGSEMVNSINASIQEAEGKLGGAPRPATSVARASEEAKSKSSGTAAAAARLSGTIKLAPAFAARVAPGDTVFVLARPAQGSRMPLAAVRVQVKDLPLKFSFDDSMAMNTSAKLSDFSEVVVAARVSKSGNVMPQPGDLEGVSKPVHPGTSGMNVEIVKEIR